MTNLAVILSYEITKGMKSFGPKGLLKLNSKSIELINSQINGIKNTIPNICIVTGFGSDKLLKKIKHDHFHIQNNYYDVYNQGYVIKTLLQKFHTIYDGVLIINNGVLIQPEKIDQNKSCVFVTKKNPKTLFNLGCIFDTNNVLENIFYDIGDYSWCESVFICKKDFATLLNYCESIDTSNMFLFEIINASVSMGVSYNMHEVHHKKIVYIKSMKDIELMKGLK